MFTGPSVKLTEEARTDPVHSWQRALVRRIPVNKSIFMDRSHIRATLLLYKISESYDAKSLLSGRRTANHGERLRITSTGQFQRCPLRTYQSGQRTRCFPRRFQRETSCYWIHLYSLSGYLFIYNCKYWQSTG